MTADGMMREDGGVGRLRRERMVVFVSLKTHPLEEYSSMELSDKGPNALPQSFPRDSHSTNIHQRQTDGEGKAISLES